MKNTRWTQEEDKVIENAIDNFKKTKKINYNQIAKILKRTEKSIKLRVTLHNNERKRQQLLSLSSNLKNKTASQLKVKKKNSVWSETEEKFLISNIKNMKNFKNKTDFIKYIASNTGFGQTTVFERLKKVLNRNKTSVKIQKKETNQIKKETVWQKIKKLFY